MTTESPAAPDARRQRGLEIAALAKIEKAEGRAVYFVPSQYAAVPTKYTVRFGETTTCTCPDFEVRGCKCKHVWAVEFVQSRERQNAARPTESTPVTKTRKTYRQDWPAYNAAQTSEKRHFLALLHDLCKGIQTPQQVGRGQRRLPLSDSVFAAVFKIYSTVSARRFTSDLCDAQSKGLITKVPHFNSVLNCLCDESVYPILLELIERSSLPLRSVESQFAVDSTGFTCSRFVRWYDVKYNRFTEKQEWVKAHICCGTKTNIITSVEIHGKDAGDATQLPSLVRATAKNFQMREVSADKGYSGLECHEAIAAVGAVPYIAFKSNATGAAGGLFQKMFHYFQFNREDFLAHYHRRSNVETAVMMVKTKFGDAVRSKSEVAGRNEVLAKILCHNICCVIQAMHELGLEPVFKTGCTTEDRPAQQNTLK